MEYINTKKSHNGFAGLLLIWIIILLIIMIFTITTAELPFSISTIIFVTVIFLLPATLCMDIVLWNITSKEIISTNKNRLKIRKTNRIFCKKKIIRFDQIKDIYLWNQKVWYIDLCMHLSFWDISRQGAICVKYKCRKYYFGRLLSEEEAQELLYKITQEMNKN
jgi:hypothetical protein